VLKTWRHADRVPRMLILISILCLASILVAAAPAQNAPPTSSSNSAPPPSPYVGNQACARCHASIYESYTRTPMAHASGPAIENLKPADFVHPKSGVHYRIYTEGEKVWLSFQRPGDPAVNDKRQLLYFIGSGHRGRSYLFAVDDFFFESPVNWYADRKVWDMAPAYGNAREIPMNLPAYASCLQCHTSGMQPPLKGTENKYSSPLFTQNGVGCERCHGPGAAHIIDAARTKTPSIINPIKLPPERRDSVCMQCHLEGNVAIERAGRHAYEFQPGDLLDNFVRHYVLATDRSSGLGANSQFEALAQSTCKKKSGDAMSCMSCHDPHFSPPAEQRASYYREKCLACHGSAFGAQHHPDRHDCTVCHMPSSLSVDISHTEVTDHRIQRHPELSPQLLQDSLSQESTAPDSSPRLIPFPYSKEADDDLRDRALAWQSLAANGPQPATAQADRLLHQAARQFPNDPAVLSGLAYVELNHASDDHGAVDNARDLYQKALALDPTLIDAAANLGVIDARSGDLQSAVKLWQDAFERAPADSSIGMNLARIFCQSGKIKDARSYVLRVLRFNPDLSSAKKLLQQLNANPPSCGN
jgi:predicted CXXCH cytochrome family protein